MSRYRSSKWVSKKRFFKWAIPAPTFSFIFVFLKQTLQFLQQINVKNVHVLGFEPTTYIHKPHPITTIPGLTFSHKCFKVHNNTGSNERKWVVVGEAFLRTWSLFERKTGRLLKQQQRPQRQYLHFGVQYCEEIYALGMVEHEAWF